MTAVAAEALEMAIKHYFIIATIIYDSFISFQCRVGLLSTYVCKMHTHFLSLTITNMHMKIRGSTLAF